MGDSQRRGLRVHYADKLRGTQRPTSGPTDSGLPGNGRTNGIHRTCIADRLPDDRTGRTGSAWSLAANGASHGVAPTPWKRLPTPLYRRPILPSKSPAIPHDSQHAPNKKSVRNAPLDSQPSACRTESLPTPFPTPCWGSTDRFMNPRGCAKRRSLSAVGQPIRHCHFVDNLPAVEQWVGYEPTLADDGGFGDSDGRGRHAPRARR